MFLLVLFAALSARASDAAPQGRPSLYRSLVEVFTTSNPPDQFAPWRRLGPVPSSGSGVVISGERILTAAHVVADAVMIEVRRAGNARRYTAGVSHVCHACDLAILKLEDDSFFSDSRPLEIGDLPRLQQPVEVHGFPKGGTGLAVTSGIVSRIAVDYYSHSFREMLLVQVDAAINSGSSGGPAISDGEVVGIAMQVGRQGENVGYVVPAPIIAHFLEDIEDGRFDGFPELGIMTQTSDNPALRRRLRLTGEGGGVLVTAVSRGGSAFGHVAPGDVLLAIGETRVDGNGGVPIGNGIRVGMRYLEHRAQIGDELELTLLRGGEQVRRRVRMRRPEPQVGMGDYDRPPSYRVYGGLVFQRLTARYIMRFDDPPSHFRWYFDNPALSGDSLVDGRETGVERRDVVVISRVLANDSTRGYGDFEDHVVSGVNGSPIESLDGLSRAIDRADTPFLAITTDQGALLVLDRSSLAAGVNEEILSQYEIARDRSPDLVSGVREHPAPYPARPASAPAFP